MESLVRHIRPSHWRPSPIAIQSSQKFWIPNICGNHSPRFTLGIPEFEHFWTSHIFENHSARFTLGISEDRGRERNCTACTSNLWISRIHGMPCATAKQRNDVGFRAPRANSHMDLKLIVQISKVHRDFWIPNTYNMTMPYDSGYTWCKRQKKTMGRNTAQNPYKISLFSIRQKKLTREYYG